MPRTLLPDDELDRILLRMAREVAESDVILSAFLALYVAQKRGHGPGLYRALDDVRSLLGLNRRVEDDDEYAVVYRLCSSCHRLHPVGRDCTVTA